MTHENHDEPCHLLRRDTPPGKLIAACGFDATEMPPGHWLTGTVAEVDCPECVTAIDAALATVAKP